PKPERTHELIHEHECRHGDEHQRIDPGERSQRLGVSQHEPDGDRREDNRKRPPEQRPLHDRCPTDSMRSVYQLATLTLSWSIRRWPSAVHSLPQATSSSSFAKNAVLSRG